ncbi:MAG: PAC2 family protein [Deltaproteobacteria bacterium]|nr:PAC2 family protein [Deltaproteobacteria bacterium]
MSDLCYLDEPELDKPALIMGFSGWPNTGEVATGTLNYLLRRLKSRPLAFLKTDAYYDFASHRPTASIQDGLVGELNLPKNKFFYIKGEEKDRDLILFLGQEPHLHWEAFSGLILSLAQDFNVKGIYALGGAYDYLPHWLEPRVSVVCSSPELKFAFEGLDRLETLISAEYQGPVSIHTMLLSKGREKGIPVFGLWGHAPVYIHTGNIKVHRRLVELLSQLINFSIDTNDLVEGIEQMNQKIQMLMQDNPQLKKFIQDLEKTHGKQGGLSTQPSMIGAPSTRGKVISIDDFLKREKENGG